MKIWQGCRDTVAGYILTLDETNFNVDIISPVYESLKNTIWKYKMSECKAVHLPLENFMCTIQLLTGWLFFLNKDMDHRSQWDESDIDQCKNATGFLKKHEVFRELELSVHPGKNTLQLNSWIKNSHLSALVYTQTSFSSSCWMPFNYLHFFCSHDVSLSIFFFSPITGWVVGDDRVQVRKILK